MHKNQPALRVPRIFLFLAPELVVVGTMYVHTCARIMYVQAQCKKKLYVWTYLGVVYSYISLTVYMYDRKFIVRASGTEGQGSICWPENH
jgi:hypothetical protein